MWDYLKRHERWMHAQLARATLGDQLPALIAHHHKQIQFMQHERLIHLIVTMFVCLFFLLSVGFALLYPSWGVAALGGLFLILTGAYIVHYFRLENGVQRWYAIANTLDARATDLPIAADTPPR